MNPLKAVIASALLLIALHLGSVATSDVDNVYPLRLTEADARFTDACLALSHADPTVIFKSFQYPGTSPEGESLFTRLCIFGDVSSPIVFLTLSGVHGNEFNSPSAVQLRMMRDYLVPEDKNDPIPRLRLPKGVRAVFIHAVSPWGAAWGFKEGHNNIDMLKNINGIYTVSANHTSPVLVDVFDNMDIRNVNNVQGFFSAFSYFMAVQAGPNGPTLRKELSYGQNQRQIGLSYYGIEAAWEATTVRNIIKEHLAGACKILLADLHTAAGKYGEWFIAGHDDPSGDIAAEWNEKSKAGATIAPLYQAGVGTDPWPFYQFVQDYYPSADFVRVVWEAGTFPQSDYEVNMLMLVHCRYYGDIRVNEPNCEPFFSTLDPAAWTGPCCKFQHDRLREFFNPHTGAYSQWPELVYNATVAPFTVMKYGLEEMLASKSECPKTKSTPTPKTSSDDSDDVSTGEAVLIALLCVAIVIGIAILVVVLKKRAVSNISQMQ